jgi:hypothetical protein
MAMRKAQDKIMELLRMVGSKYKDSAMFQDALETLGGAAVAATGQAIFTDMTPEEIALSTLLGGGAAFAARPVAAGIGGRIGRVLDERNPGMLQGVPADVAAVFPGSPASVMQFENLRKAATSEAEKKTLQVLRDLQLAKYRQNFKGRGDIEGALTAIGRYSGDNMAQAAVALATPLFLGGNEEES